MLNKHLCTGAMLLGLSVFFAGCSDSPTLPESAVDPDRQIKVTILHMNDVYEITPVGGGTEGGLARIATLIKQLKQENPNTIVTHAGDIFSPSAMGTAKVDGVRLNGAQMVAVLNELGGIYATFGNHEFDIDRESFYSRLAESRFSWISGNVRDEKGKPYPKVENNKTLTFTDAETGKEFTIGILGLTLDANRPDYVSYLDVMKTAASELEALKQTDFQLALTHLFIEDDVKLDEAYPAIDLILGGHEHINYQRWRGDFTPVLKADANVRSVYIIRLSFDPKTGMTTINPQIMPITDAIAEDAVVKRVVDQWQDKAFAAFRAQGFNPEAVIGTTDVPLDGLEANVRSRQTDLTRLIAGAMLAAYPQADISLYNGGSIRIDDTLPAGKISEYDVIRVLPFGGNVELAGIKGLTLKKILDTGIANKGTGGFLQYANVVQLADGSWQVNGAAIDPQMDYKVAISDFLLTGKERNLDFLTPENPDVNVLDSGEGKDIRRLVIDSFKGRE